MVAIAAAVLVAFIGGLYFITHHKKEEAEAMQNRQAAGNGLPPKPEERWRYIKELESRQPGVRAPTEPTAGGEVMKPEQLTDEQRQLLAQMQATLRQQLTQINDQIDLLQRSQNTTSVQLESLRKNRSAALYDLMDSLDAGDYEDTNAEKENYILAQNKLWVITGEVASFSDQITALTQQAATVQSQLGNPSQITAPQTGYFIRSSSSGRLNAGSADILALDAANLKAYVESSPEIALDGCAGKIVSGFTWYYAGVCSAKQAEKLLGRDGKPLTKSVEIRFPGQVETPLKAKVSEVNIDAENDIARFVLSCEIINGDVLRLNCADAQIIVGRNIGLRVPAAAVHYLKEDGSEAEGQGENYIPGVYVKYGNLARFCRIDSVDDAHPQITDGDDLIVLPSGTAGSVSQVRLYDEIIVSGQNLYDGKLL